VGHNVEPPSPLAKPLVLTFDNSPQLENGRVSAHLFSLLWGID
jgi:hypothetical protein